MSFPMIPLSGAPGWTPNYFPLAGDSGVLFQGAGNSVLRPPFPEPETGFVEVGAIWRPGWGICGVGGPRGGRLAFGSWLCPEWPWTNRLPPL